MNPGFRTKYSAIIDWLLDKGGPIIRYRTTVELLGCTQGVEYDRRVKDLVESPLAKRWLENLVDACTHASWDNAFENAMGKLIDMGFRAGMPAPDARIVPFLRYAETLRQYKGMHATLEIAIVLGGLVRAGYDTKSLRELLQWRLNMLHEATKDRNYDIYASEEDSERIPHSYRGKQLVRPEFYEPDGLRLPYVHDLLALSRAGALLSSREQRSIDDILGYIFDVRYQSLKRGYGCLIRMDRGRPRCNAIGWSAHLPGFSGFRNGANYPDLVFWIDLLSHFRAARQHRWFREALDHLNSFRTPRNTWCFPAGYLNERQGYYVLGAHMRLDSQATLEQVSTLRMLCVLNRCETTGRS